MTLNYFSIFYKVKSKQLPSRLMVSNGHILETFDSTDT